MKLGDFTGIRGIPSQDIAMWETMGPIADRTKERLGASDLAVVEFRRLMVDASHAMQNGGPALGRTEPHVPHAKIRSFESILPKSTDWRTLGVAPERAARRATSAWRKAFGTVPRSSPRCSAEIGLAREVG